MNKKDINFGIKVVPHNKTVWGDLDESHEWKEAKESNKNYLYVTGFDEDVNAYVLSNKKQNKDVDGNDGDFFNVEDFEPYIEKNVNEAISVPKELLKDIADYTMYISISINNFLNKQINSN